MTIARKIINDPVYGFITIDHPLVMQIISNPVYQRLRNIHQMAFAHLVYPGATHSRLHHSLGAYHLMCMALRELKGKGVAITEDEELGAKVAILLHDLGHGPFSHALESELIRDLNHEKISLLLMQQLNKEYDGQLRTAIEIFTNQYPKKFLHQLVSGQLDVDRMDYLNRDSFFTGVAEGVIGYDRIIKMLTVHNGELMVEEKAIYSIEKFLVSRRLMYWQVYLHKTVLAAELMLIMVMRRAKELIREGRQLRSATPDLDLFLQKTLEGGNTGENLEIFCRLDDHDIMATIKIWTRHEDNILSMLCRCLVERKLYKVKLQSTPFAEELITEKKKELQSRLGYEDALMDYLVLSGTTSNTTYNPEDERINILFKDGSVRDISGVDHALIHKDLNTAIKKYYFCHYR